MLSLDHEFSIEKVISYSKTKMNSSLIFHYVIQKKKTTMDAYQMFEQLLTNHCEFAHST
jgi:hypothetical protein